MTITSTTTSRFLAFRPSKSFVFCCVCLCGRRNCLLPSIHPSYVSVRKALLHHNYNITTASLFSSRTTMGNGNNFHFDILLALPIRYIIRLLWKLTTSYFSTTFHSLVSHLIDTQIHEYAHAHTIKTLKISSRIGFFFSYFTVNSDGDKL